MKLNSQTLPIVLGVSIILVTSTSLGGILTTFSRSVAEKETESAEEIFLQNQPPDVEATENRRVYPENNTNRGSGVNPDPSPGIKIGTYSNPPTRINSFDYSVPSNNRRDNSLGNANYNQSQNSLTEPNRPGNFPAPGTSSSGFDDRTSSDAFSNESLLEAPNYNDFSQPTSIDPSSSFDESDSSRGISTPEDR